MLPLDCWDDSFLLNLEDPGKAKRVRSMKCCICNEVKKTVTKAVDPWTLKYLGVSDVVSMCPECLTMGERIGY